MEFFADIREKSQARLYMSVMLTRRTLFVLIIIFGIEAPRHLIYSLLLGRTFIIINLVFQIIYTPII